MAGKESKSIRELYHDAKVSMTDKMGVCEKAKWRHGDQPGALEGQRGVGKDSGLGSILRRG